MAHKGDTQANSEAMPKVPHTLRRNGTFYFNARYPLKLVEAGKVPREFNRESLSTKDPSEARKLAGRKYVLHLSEIDRLEAEMEGADWNERSKSQRGISGVTVAEQKSLILRWFVEREIAESDSRESFRGESEEQQELILDSAITDLGVYQGSTAFPPVDWKRETHLFFEAHGISCEGEKINDTVIQLFRRAKTEIHWRTVAAYEGRERSWNDEVFRKHSAFSEVEKEADGGHTVAEICERFPKRKKEGKLSLATLVSYALPLRIVEQLWGSQTQINRLGYEDGETLIEFLSKIPTNADRRFKGLSLKEAIEIENAKKNPKIISPKRQKDLFQTIKAVLNHAAEIGWIVQNPLSSKALLDRLPRVEKRDREQFTATDLNRIFSNPRFVNAPENRNRKGSLTIGNFWVPLLGLFHGMRANEAASLMTCDVKKEGGIAYLWFRETDDKGNWMKGLKTEASRRKIPIHSELIKIGFLEFAEQREKDSPDGFLFPEMLPNEQTGNRAKIFSQFFGRLVKDALGGDVAEFGKDYHSFRHAVTDCLRDVTDSDEKRYALLGWVEGAGKRNAGFNYGSGFKMKELKRLIDKVTFPELDLGHLYSGND